MQRPYLKRLMPALAMLFILGSAFFIYWLFASGISEPSDLTNFDRMLQSAGYFQGGEFVSAFQQSRAELGGLRNLLYYAPYLLIVSIFGNSAWSTLVLPLVLSLASVYLVYVIAKLLVNSNAAGLSAAVLWGYFPLGIFFSTAAPKVSTLTFLFLLGTLLAFLAFKKGNAWVYVFSLLAGLNIFLWEPRLLFPLVIIAVHIGTEAGTPKLRAWLSKLLTVIAVVAGFFLILTWRQLGPTFLDLYSLILNQPEMVFFLPLFIVAITVLSFERTAGLQTLLDWVIILLFGYVGIAILFEAGSAPDLFNAGVFLQPIFAFLTIIAGIYLSKNLDERKAPIWAIALAFTGVLGSSLAVVGSREFLPSFQGFDWVSLHSLFLIFSILAGVAFAGVLASPYLITGENRDWKTKSRFVLFTVIILATLPFSWKRRIEYRYLNEAPAQALAYIAEHRPFSSIYSLNEGTVGRLSLQSKLQEIGENDVPAINLIALEEIDQIQEGLVLVFEDELPAALPANWWRMDSFGLLGSPRMLVYEVRTQEKANEFIAEAEPENVDLLDLSGALINAGLLCEAYRTWENGAQLNTSIMNFVPYNIEADCVRKSENLVNIEELKNQDNLDGYIYFPAPLDGTNSLNIAQVSLPIYDMRTSSIALDLQPETLYLYSIEIMTPSPTATLYWKFEDDRDYLEMRSYPEWTTVSMLIRTPSWGEPKTVSFSPVLFDHLDVVSIRNFFIGPVMTLAIQQ